MSNPNRPTDDEEEHAGNVTSAIRNVDEEEEAEDEEETNDEESREWTREEMEEAEPYPMPEVDEEDLEDDADNPE